MKNLCVILFQYWLDHLSSFVSLSFHIRWIFWQYWSFRLCLFCSVLFCCIFHWNEQYRSAREIFVSFQLLTWEILLHSDLEKRSQRSPGDCRWQNDICFVLYSLFSVSFGFDKSIPFLFKDDSVRVKPNFEWELTALEITDGYISCLTYFRVDKIN